MKSKPKHFQNSGNEIKGNDKSFTDIHMVGLKKFVMAIKFLSRFSIFSLITTTSEEIKTTYRLSPI